MAAPDPATAPLVIAYDGSEEAQLAVERAAGLWAGRPAIVLTIWQSAREVAPAAVVALSGSVAEDALGALDAGAERAAGALAEEGAVLARRHGLSATSATAPARGNVWATISHAAGDRGAAVIVVGSRGRSGIRSAVLGSTSAGLVHHARQPVLVVRADAS